MAHRLRLAARLGGLVALGGSRAHAMKTEDEPKQRRFVAGDAFKKLTSEPGEHGECPVWEPAPNVVQYSSTAGKAVERIDIEQVPGAFMLSNVLAPGECESLAALAEAMGFVDDAPLKLERNDLRRNTHCLMIADDTLWRPIWERCMHLFPAQQRSEGACGLNQRFRMYKYEAGGAFGPHRDSCWPGSAVVDGKHVGNAFDDRWSKMTFLLCAPRWRLTPWTSMYYIRLICCCSPHVCAQPRGIRPRRRRRLRGRRDDLSGAGPDQGRGGPQPRHVARADDGRRRADRQGQGAAGLGALLPPRRALTLKTTLWSSDRGPGLPPRSKRLIGRGWLKPGAALEHFVSMHRLVCDTGAHDLSMMHAGGKVQSGVKRVIRSDVLYYLPDKGPVAMAEERRMAAAREEAATRAAAQTADWEQKAEGFTASEIFTGPVAGAVFRRGRHGQGYYRDALAAQEASGLAEGLDRLSVQG